MLNLELARIVVAERQRTIRDGVREGRFRRDIADRNASLVGASQADQGAQACQDAAQRARPALG